MRRALLLLALLVLAACASPTAPAEPDRSCVLTQTLTLQDGTPATVRAYYTVCPDTTTRRP